MFGVIRADQSISFNAMKEKMRTFMLKIKEDPAINQVTGYTGSGQTNNARLFISLKPLSERKVSADEVIDACARKRHPNRARPCFCNPCRTSAWEAARAMRSSSTPCRATT